MILGREVQELEPMPAKKDDIVAGFAPQIHDRLDAQLTGDRLCKLVSEPPADREARRDPAHIDALGHGYLTP